jgi:hypothetical protein
MDEERHEGRITDKKEGLQTNEEAEVQYNTTNRLTGRQAANKHAGMAGSSDRKIGNRQTDKPQGRQ